MKKNKSFFGFCIITFLCLSVVGYFLIFNSKTYTNEDFKIPTYISGVDKDLDGIDDQTDILNETRKYISTKPKYKSKYYATGYPNDEYGVCTDVVATALFNAGYDLRELVNEDVINYPDDYDIENRDKNIDFRRVNNLNVYFKRSSIILTTDIDDYKEWQGGDIVVFNRHIGIVSNKRNKKGIPYVIHHANPFQISYEENILEKMTLDIVGHYRIS